MEVDSIPKDTTKHAPEVIYVCTTLFSSILIPIPNEVQQEPNLNLSAAQIEKLNQNLAQY